MINVTEMLRKEGHYSLFERITSYRDPELYHAENMKDFLGEASTLPYPLYKSFPSVDNQMHRAYITIYDVGLTRLHYPDDVEGSKPTHFLVHDESGEAKMNWEAERDIFPLRNTFSDVSSEAGLTEDDWVFNVFFVHLINEGLSYICEVQKNRPRRRIKGETPFEKARDFLGDPEPSFA